MNSFKITKHKGIYLHSNLLQAKEETLHHERHKNILAHPADILSDKTSILSKDVCKLISAAYVSDPLSEELQALTKNTILASNEFYDALFLIIKCLTPPTEIDNKDVTRWLKENKSKACSRFIDATSASHKPFRDMANKLKHGHANIANLELVNHRGARVYGFYIQTAVGAEDQRGPDPEIHKRYKKIVNTAFSYNHFLLYLIGHIYNCMYQLNKCIFERKPTRCEPFNDLLELTAHFEHIEQQFFPDEFLRPFANIKKEADGYNVEFPYRHKKSIEENFDRIDFTRAYQAFNPRTGKSHAIIPYLQLLYPHTLPYNA
jgi:hypothetical protein